MVVVGVETADDHNMLTELGVGFGQGHLYGRPTKSKRHKLARKTT
jgi:EAL domain-containing protein (putative c-di-GMP-specific phosphodiesterase class I)